MTIRGTTALVAHLGFPTDAFVSPLIYNPYFEQAGIDAVVVPMGCRAEHFPEFLAAVFRLTNVRGALITMPHKVTTVALLDEASPAVRIAGSCNAVRRTAGGRLQGDLFDGEGFVRACVRRGAGSRRPGARRRALAAWVRPLRRRSRRPAPRRLRCATPSADAARALAERIGSTIRTSSVGDRGE